MGYLGEDIKKLGFGLMRLPRKDGKIDIEQTKVMVDMFLAAGFTYFDTAFVYEGSEDAIRQALVERYPREKYLLATKNAAWMKCACREDAIAQFETSLRRTGAGYFDFYLLHNLGQNRTAKFEEFDLWNWALEKKKEGLIRHLGFSLHASAEELDAILTAHPEAEFVQLQINYADWEDKGVQSRACYEVARRHGKPVVIMEPVKGGMLADPPATVQAPLRAVEPDSSPASWAIRFAADLDGVLTVLSGMSSIEQMKDNLSYMSTFTGLNETQKQAIAGAQKALSEIPLIPCTSCNYCAKVCPQHIAISAAFSIANRTSLYGNAARGKADLANRVKNENLAFPSACIACGQCEEVCPQHIAIRDELVSVSKVLE